MNDLVAAFHIALELIGRLDADLLEIVLLSLQVSLTASAKRRPGPGVACAPSRLLAQGSTCRHCVTRCLNGATHWFRCRNSHCGAVAVTRCLASANLLF